MSCHQPITPHAALIYTMILVSAADRDMNDFEFSEIGIVAQRLPVFRDFDAERLTETAQECAVLVSARDGLEKILNLISNALPAHLHETAFALACEVAASDRKINAEEKRILELLRRHLGINELAAAAIEHAAEVRTRTL